jgi:hypothetical protein
VAVVVSRFTPLGGHTLVLARRVKYAAKSPLKNISSDASQTMVPTVSNASRRLVVPAGAAAADVTEPPFYMNGREEDYLGGSRAPLPTAGM